MFVIFGNYTAPLDEVDSHREAHLAFIGELVASGNVVASGRRAEGDGSALVLSAGSRDEALALFDNDPYVTAGVVEYELAAEFTAGAKAPGLESYS
ncbi:MAG: hypothetical protein F2813_05490 [Actinobacteria bacterium]|uniref:Unannotated protein n=1 Tax=freshwater metagenome TaxID=449393 RepID=A0A6J5ZVW1_9ZZZZ|nr:hypothetical protein [Actinomycetota bacterium]